MIGITDLRLFKGQKMAWRYQVQKKGQKYGRTFENEDAMWNYINRLEKYFRQYTKKKVLIDPTYTKF